MGLIKKYLGMTAVVVSVSLCVLTACSISYKFNGSSINYER